MKKLLKTNIKTKRTIPPKLLGKAVFKEEEEEEEESMTSDGNKQYLT